ncbi:ArsR/SmtB family transcription factor [Brevibacillus sp. H7]|uniref:ArsR/SmtB family transcription factor n=1 Tax=Brevibacillus sp. H7 TaxID=3349138 RepID=UPI00380068EF
MNNQYSMTIEYSPAYELVLSLYAYIHQRDRKNIRLGNDWRKETVRKLPAGFAAELEDERWEVMHRIVLLIAQSTEKDTVEKFLAWLERLPPGEIYERLAPWVSSIPLNLGEVRDRSLYLLSKWHEHYFSRLDADILRRLERDAERLAERAQTVSPIDLVEEATHGLRIEPTENLRQVILAPQYHCSPATILDFYRGIATCLYPSSQEGGGEDDSISRLLPVTQCLADEKRLQILRCLAQKPQTLSDIQKQVKLAKSTVHHHLTALRRAGMVRSHYSDSTTAAWYSLREPFVDRLNTELQQFLWS